MYQDNILGYPPHTHSVSKNCIFNQKCNRKLCPYRHSENKRSDKNDTNDPKNTIIDDLEDENSESIDNENATEENV